MNFNQAAEHSAVEFSTQRARITRDKRSKMSSFAILHEIRGYEAATKYNGRSHAGCAPAQLYNPKNDLGEKYNLAAKHPEVVEELSRLIQKIKDYRCANP